MEEKSCGLCYNTQVFTAKSSFGKTLIAARCTKKNFRRRLVWFEKSWAEKKAESCEEFDG